MYIYIKDETKNFIGNTIQIFKKKSLTISFFWDELVLEVHWSYLGGNIMQRENTVNRNLSQKTFSDLEEINWFVVTNVCDQTLSTKTQQKPNLQ